MFYIRTRPQATIDPTSVTPADAAPLVRVFDKELAMASALRKTLVPKWLDQRFGDESDDRNQGSIVDRPD